VTPFLLHRSLLFLGRLACRACDFCIGAALSLIFDEEVYLVIKEGDQRIRTIDSNNLGVAHKI